MNILDAQIEALNNERRGYLERLRALLGTPGRETEVNGYLIILERLTDASIRLVRQCAEDVEGHTQPSKAA